MARATAAATMLMPMLMLAACDGGTSEAARTKSIGVAQSNEYVERLKGLSELNRGLALRRAIQDTGGICKKVDASGYQQDYKQLSMWTARCPDGKDWAIFIAPNADVQVRECKDLATLGLPACRFAEAG